MTMTNVVNGEIASEDIPNSSFSHSPRYLKENVDSMPMNPIPIIISGTRYALFNIDLPHRYSGCNYLQAY